MHLERWKVVKNAQKQFEIMQKVKNKFKEWK